MLGTLELRWSVISPRVYLIYEGSKQKLSKSVMIKLWALTNTCP